MDIFWIVIGCIFMLVGLAGCFLPFLPGPPLSYVGFIVLQFREKASFTSSFMWTWAAIVIIITLLDYVVPAYGTKKFGGSKFGIAGCTIGLIVGIWMGPLGIIFGPFLGAFIGELISNKNSNQAFKAAMGSFAGFLFGTLLKFITCFIMVWYFVKAI